MVRFCRLTSFPLLLTVVLFTLTVAPAKAQYGFQSREPLAGQPKFQLDAAAFGLFDEGKVRVEVYYRIPADGLRFAKEKDRYRAEYEMAVVLADKKGRQIDATTFSEKISVDSYQETQSKGDLLINQLNFTALPGEYKVVATLTDRNSGQTYSQTDRLKAQPFQGGAVTLSTLEFARTVFDSTEAGRFQKGHRFVLPAVSRLYSDSLPRLVLYYEVYSREKQPSTFQVDYFAASRSLRKRVIDTATVTAVPGVTPVVASLNVSRLPPGAYTLSAVVKVSKGKEVCHQEGEFIIAWSLASILRNDFFGAVEQLRYIATAAEMKALKRSRSAERLKNWDEFWRKKDPSPGTPENEAAEEYFRRIRYANANFTVGLREGWKTDLGRVYVIYGEPDQIEVHPFERDAKPYQVWFYYQSTRSLFPRTFVFVDETGFGDYELQYPYDGVIRSF